MTSHYAGLGVAALAPASSVEARSSMAMSQSCSFFPAYVVLLSAAFLTSRCACPETRSFAAAGKLMKFMAHPDEVSPENSP